MNKNEFVAACKADISRHNTVSICHNVEWRYLLQKTYIELKVGAPGLLYSAGISSVLGSLDGLGIILRIGQSG